jgi:uncharacterized membrane protein YdbT with pleckstrin-like domain
VTDGRSTTLGAMAGSQIDLMPGEEMILYSNPHWWYFWKDAVAGLVFLLLLFLVVQADSGWLNDGLWFLTVVAFLVFVVMTVYAFVQWKSTKFAITTERVAYQSGIIRRRGVSIPLNRVNNVNFTQSMIARMLNNGVVIIESAGETGDSVFENIPDPEKVRALIFKQVEADEQRDSDRDAASLAKALRDQAPPAPTTGAPSVPERLKQLDDLRAQGLVSDAEYDVKRKQIIEDL